MQYWARSPTFAAIVVASLLLQLCFLRSATAASDPPNSTAARHNTDLRKFLDTSVSSISGHIAGASYRAGEAGAQATAQSERTKPVLVANRFHAISQASMMSAKLRNTEL